MKWSSLVIVALSLLFVGACAPAAEPPKPAPVGPTPADTAAINKLRDDFIAAFNANDAARVTDVYSEDAVLLPNNHPLVEGRQAILAYEQDFFSKFAATVTLASSETRFEGNWAFDSGTYQMKLTPKPKGKEIQDSGKYLVLIQRQKDGSWKVIRDVDNSDGPPPAGKM